MNLFLSRIQALMVINFHFTNNNSPVKVQFLRSCDKFFEINYICTCAKLALMNNNICP